VSPPITCENFLERLDGLMARAPRSGQEYGGPEWAGLEAHATSCADCARLLRVHRQLAAPTSEEIEEQVPEDLVTGMWARVAAATAGATAGTGPGEQAAGSPRVISAPPVRPPAVVRPRSWIVPALAAAVMVLLFATGYLVAEVRQLHRQEGLLTAELQRQGELLDTLSRPGSDRLAGGFAGSAAGAAASALGRAPAGGFAAGAFGRGGRLPLAVAGDRWAETGYWPGAPAWTRGVAGRDEVTAGELMLLLDWLPPQTVILGPAEVERLRRTPLAWRHQDRLDELTRLRTDDGLRAGAAIQILDAMDLDPTASISRTRLATLVSELFGSR